MLCSQIEAIEKSSIQKKHISVSIIIIETPILFFEYVIIFSKLTELFLTYEIKNIIIQYVSEIPHAPLKRSWCWAKSIIIEIPARRVPKGGGRSGRSPSPLGPNVDKKSTVKIHKMYLKYQRKFNLLFSFFLTQKKWQQICQIYVS